MLFTLVRECATKPISDSEEKEVFALIVAEVALTLAEVREKATTIRQREVIDLQGGVSAEEAKNTRVNELFNLRKAGVKAGIPEAELTQVFREVLAARS